MVRLRRATPSDASRIVDIRCAAFQTPLSEYMDTSHVVNRLSSRIDVTSTILHNDNDTLVALNDDDDDEIIGFCHYTLEDPSIPPISWSLGHLEAFLVGWEQWLFSIPTIIKYRHKYLERAKKYANFSQTLKENKKVNTVSLKGLVYVKILVVDPVYQGRNVGRTLLNHCLTLAKQKGVPAYLESSIVGYPFYKKAGFRDFGEAAVFKDEDGKVITTLPVVLWTP